MELSIYQILAYVIVILGGITSVIFHIGVKENQHQEIDSEQLIDFRPPTRRISSLFRDSNLYIVCVVYISTRLFCNLSQMYIPYYIHTYLKLPSTNLAVFPLVMYSSSFATSTFIKEINVEFGRKVSIEFIEYFDLCNKICEYFIISYR